MVNTNIFSSFFRSPAAIKQQLFIPLYFGRVYERIRRTVDGLKPREENSPTNGWISIPELPKTLNFYLWLSIGVMVYPILLEILPVNWLVQVLGGTKPSYCYFVGRDYVYLPITRSVDLVSSIVHLSFRAYQQYNINTRMKLDIVSFMIQSDEQIALLSERMADKRFNWRQNEQAKNILCYHIRHLNSNRVTYKQRPHRTLEAKWRLDGRLVHYSRVFGSLLLIGTVVTFPYLFYLISSDHSYVTLYPGCYPELDLIYRNKNRHEVGWSSTLTGPRIHTLFADVFRTSVIWADFGLGLIIVQVTAYLLNDDLLAYWQIIDQRINHVLEHSRRLDAERRSSLVAGGDLYDQSELPEILTNRRLSSLERKQRDEPKPVDPSQTDDRSNTEDGTVSQMDTLPFDELLGLLRDFFQQVKDANSYMMEMLSMGIIIWFSIFALFSYGAAIGLGDAMIIRLLEVFAFINFSVFCLYLLSLHRVTTRSYPKICSLVPCISDKQTRLRFVKTLEFYSSFNQNTYTFLGLYPFKPTSFLTITGSNLSMAVAIEQFFGRTHDRCI